jgi:uracil-DNA glycosylase
VVTVTVGDYEEWRRAARQLLNDAIPPESIAWLAASEQAVLPFPALDLTDESGRTQHSPRVPRRFVDLAETAACHRSSARWDALYRLFWRVVHDGSAVLDCETDDDVRMVKEMAANVRHDDHKMRAFVRFTPIASESGTRYVAWYEPDHLIVRRAAPFFADRFSSLDWWILTPDLSAHWDTRALTFTDGVTAPLAQRAGEIEDLWRVYYEAVFNPARVNLRAMARDMPYRRWRNLPEASLIPELVKTAHERTARLDARRSSVTARAFVPETDDLRALREAAARCRGCPLFEPATQAVFGEGPRDADIVLVGEQPGDAEDIAGCPFVGPAGQVLDRALAAAGIDRARVYVTNAVKHFSFEPRGKRRIHQTPRYSEMRACRPWLEAELQAIRPATVVAMGSTAARALIGPQAKVMAIRGRVLEGLAWASRVVVTVHPSAVLRSEDEGARYFDMLAADLALAARDMHVAAKEVES